MIIILYGQTLVCRSFALILYCTDDTNLSQPILKLLSRRRLMQPVSVTQYMSGLKTRLNRGAFIENQDN
jgi:hypothetical protein